MTYRPLPQGLTLDALLALHEQAADWYVRRLQPGWTSSDERALEVWLEADPVRREIMAGLDSTWQQADLLKAPRLRASGAHGDAPVSGQIPPRPVPVGAPRGEKAAWTPFPLSFSRRGFLVPALAVAGVALVAGGWQRWDATANYSLDIATGGRETRTLDLPDGSRIDLNVASALRVRFYPRRREVVLNRGEAFFQVAADADRPFTVDSGPSRVRVVGTAFNVRAAPPQLVVKVLEGRVEVRPDHREPAGAVLLLRQGSGVGIDPSSGRYRSLSLAPETVGSWRSGQVHFSRTPLEEVAQELATYLGQPVVVAGADLKSVPISGFLAVQSPEDFIQALPDVVPVRVDRLADGSWRIARR